jgi:predicted transcriptional regulator
MVTKPEVMKALEELPENATLQDAMDRLLVLHKIERGLQDIEAGRVVSDEELDRRIKNWRK